MKSPKPNRTLVQVFLAEIGRKGGQKSRRKLATREARRIASAGWEGAVGEARRAKLRAKTHNAKAQQLAEENRPQ